MKSISNKNKMYFTIGLIMVIVVSAWILNLKNAFNKSNQSPSELDKLAVDEKWDKMTSDLSKIFGNIKKLQEYLGQSPTSTAAQLQSAAEISPEQLNQLLEKLKIEISTTTTSTDLQLLNNTATDEK